VWLLRMILVLKLVAPLLCDAEALTGHAGDEGLAARGTVEGHVAGDDVFLEACTQCPRAGGR
jgi:hypothetical protein